MNTTFLLISSKIVLVCFWFLVGIFSFRNFNIIKNIFQNYSFFELAIIFYIFFLFLNLMGFLFKFLIFNYIITIELNSHSLIDNLHFFSGDNSTSSGSAVPNGNASNSGDNSTISGSVSANGNTTNSVVEKNTPIKTESISSTSNPTSSNESKPTTSYSRSYTASNVNTDAGLMGAGLAGGMAIAKHSPNLAVKILAPVSGIVAGGVAIMAKNIAGNISSDIGRPKDSKFLADLTNQIEIYLGLTNNNGLDLLLLIQIFQKIQLYLLFGLVYVIIIQKIDIVRLEAFFTQNLPPILKRFIKFYIKSLMIVQKHSFITTIFLLFFLLFSNYYAYYYLDFFISNLDKIIELYFK